MRTARPSPIPGLARVGGVQQAALPCNIRTIEKIGFAVIDSSCSFDAHWGDGACVGGMRLGRCLKRVTHAPVFSLHG
ncbi:protein of unknown function [Pararobbsia alpina]